MNGITNGITNIITTVFITGGTGSLGSHLVKKFSLSSDIHIVIFSRDEQKQYKMRLEYNDPSNISFVLGDVRDQQSVMDAITHYQPSVVIHTAAQKHVKVCEHNPMQTVLTNVHGTKHIVRACIANEVGVACFVSTDKAIEPTTLYGMTKHIAERIWENASKSRDKHGTKFVGVRYGNILNSNGSLIPLYLQRAQNPFPLFPLTDDRMTRFFITFDQAIALIINTVRTLLGWPDDPNAPDIYTIDKGIFSIPKLPAARIEDIASIFADTVAGGDIEKISPFESEKLHESLVSGYSSKDHVIAKAAVRQILMEEGLLPCK